MDSQRERMLTPTSPSASLSPRKSNLSWFRKIVSIFVVLLLISSVSIELVSFKNTATSFPFSACFIICLFCLFHSILMFLICIYKIYVTHQYPISILSLYSISSFIPQGILRSLSISIIFIAISREIPGSLMIILIQLPTPLSIIISRFLNYKKRHKLPSIAKPHLTAILLILIGCVFGLIASFTGNLGNNYIHFLEDNHSVNAWWYTPILIVCCIPQSILILYTENQAQSQSQSSIIIPIELYNAWVYLIQSFVTFLLTPCLIYIGNPESMHFMNDWVLYIHQTFQCLFTDDDDILYCPNGTKYTIIIFIIWLISSILVPLLSYYIKYNISPLISRFSIICGILCAFIFFQINFPNDLLLNNKSHNGDVFSEYLLLGILCSIVGSSMLLIDFNPKRSTTLLDDFEFDELNNEKQIKSQLLMLKQKHESLQISQSKIIKKPVNNDDDDDDGDDGGMDRDVPIIVHRTKRQSVNNYAYRNRSHSLSNTEYVSYLLMEQQKQILEEEYNSKLKEFKRAELKRSQSFHSEFYSTPNNNNKNNKNNRKKISKKNKKKIGKKQYVLNEKQIKQYYKLLQNEHIRRKNILDDYSDDDDDKDVYQTSQFHINDPLTNGNYYNNKRNVRTYSESNLLYNPFTTTDYD